MLYKVTPMMTPPVVDKPKAREPGQPRKRRKSAVYDVDGQEVLISLMCLKCKGLKPLAQFGLRKMADGAIRNQPWCRTCRSGAGTKKPQVQVEQVQVEQVQVEQVEVVTSAPALQVVPAAPPEPAVVLEG